jgi:hypothetical protein
LYMLHIENNCFLNTDLHVLPMHLTPRFFHHNLPKGAASLLLPSPMLLFPPRALALITIRLAHHPPHAPAQPDHALPILLIPHLIGLMENQLTVT